MTEQHEIRFGTSGFRGRWGIEFTEVRVKWVAEAICSDLVSSGYSGNILVLGYDSRLHADKVAQWCAEVIVAHNFQLHLTSRDTPTPALIYYGIEVLGESQIAGVINCTASHNPIEWQGIKFSPSNGCPAPPDVTSRIEKLANQYQDDKKHVQSLDLSSDEAQQRLTIFDPRESYCNWILKSGVDDNRIKLNHSQMREYFQDKGVVIDEMHGTGRGYLRRILDQIGIGYEVLHGERDPTLGELHTANPEEPYIGPLKEHVAQSHAALGIGLDTDADRYGIVDGDGTYFTPNQILAMLIQYLVVERKIYGRVAVSHVTSRLIETVAGHILAENNLRPRPGALPRYMTAPDYEVIWGDPSEFSTENVFTVPVGLKYIVEVPKLGVDYTLQPETPANWREVLLIGGEESSGLTTKGHVPDKDGIWAGLLVMDMMAHYEKTLHEIWSAITEQYWDSHTLRLNVDVPDEIKSAFIDYFFDQYSERNLCTFGNFDVIYAGGIRGKLIELRLRDADGNKNYFLQSRPSGTEPLIRVYIEAEREAAVHEIEKEVRRILESTLTA